MTYAVVLLYALGVVVTDVLAEETMKSPRFDRFPPIARAGGRTLIVLTWPLFSSYLLAWGFLSMTKRRGPR